jgi:putative oxidoreductase
MATTSAVVSETQPQTRAWPRVLLALGRVVLGAIFLYAAYAKLHFNGSWHLRDYYFFFGMAINSYNLLPLWAVELLSRFMPWFELALGFFLVIGIGLRLTSLIASALLLVFIAAMTRAYILGLEIVCGCFGNTEKLGPWTLTRDSSMLVLALAVALGAFLINRRRTAVSS